MISVAVTGLAAWASAQEPSPADSSTSSLESELDALLREIGRAESVESFGEHQRPDLLVLSTQTVQGEIAPCG